MAPALAASLDGHCPRRVVRDGFELAPAGDPLAGMLSADVATVLPDDFLVKVDRASMAAGLEVRPPLLDHELLELAARIPSRYKVRGGRTKWIFKEAYRGRLPDEVMDRPKQGFEIPVDDWLRGPLRPMFEATVLDPDAPVGGLIDRDVARRLYRDHLARSGRHGKLLWGLLILARWADRYLPAPPLRSSNLVPAGPGLPLAP
jgi:asparagine synthase (glutamine-hydrolysing)